MKPLPVTAFYLKSLRSHAKRLKVTKLAAEVIDHERFATWSGSSKPEQHHYGIGGLAEHTYEVVEMSLDIRTMWAPNVSETEVFLAALYHDVGKCWDYTPDPKLISMVEHTDDWTGTPHKRLVHHISRSALEWSRAAAKHGYLDTDDAVLHAILAHHGQREWGSPVAPKTKLAWLIHLCDGLSARLDDCDRWDPYSKGK